MYIFDVGKCNRVYGYESSVNEHVNYHTRTKFLIRLKMKEREIEKKFL